MIEPFYTIYKLAHTSYQKTNTQLQIKALTTLINHYIIPTTRITKLITISVAITLCLSLPLTTHQAHSIPPQYIHPTNSTKTMPPYRTLRKFPPKPNPHSPPYPHIKLSTNIKYKPYLKHKMTLVRRPSHKPSLKNYGTNKWKPHINTKHTSQANSYACLSIRHYTLHIHKPHPKSHPYSKLKPHTTHQLHPNNKMTSDYRLLHTTNNKRHTQDNYSNHRTHLISTTIPNLTTN